MQYLFARLAWSSMPCSRPVWGCQEFRCCCTFSNQAAPDPVPCCWVGPWPSSLISICSWDSGFFTSAPLLVCRKPLPKDSQHHGAGKGLNAGCPRCGGTGQIKCEACTDGRLRRGGYHDRNIITVSRLVGALRQRQSLACITWLLACPIAAHSLPMQPQL